MMFFVVVLRRQEYTINTTNAFTYSTEFTTVHSWTIIFFLPPELVYTIFVKHFQDRAQCCHFVRELVVRNMSPYN